MTRTVKLLPLAASLVMVFWAGDLIAHGSGVTGKAQSPYGCSCHDSGPNAGGAVTVTLAGPAAVKPSATAHYTLSVSGGPAGTTGGFDLACANGTFTAVAGCRVSGVDVTHADNSRRSWDFDWTAPATDGTSSFYAIAQTTNGSGTGGDSWNWYGGAVNTAFPVLVSSVLGVDDPESALRFAPVAPNPVRGAARFAFSTPRDGPVRLALFDAHGRRVASLVDGDLPAGRHVVSWDGRGYDGRPLASGSYFARLDAAGGRRTQHMIKVD